MILKGSNVKILTGKDKNKNGEVIEIDRKNKRAKEKGLNIIKNTLNLLKKKKVEFLTKKIL